MYVRMVGGGPQPPTWQEYERLFIRSAEDPDVVMALRPGAWQEYALHFLRGTEDPDEFFDFGPLEPQDQVVGYDGDERSRAQWPREELECR